MSNKSILPIGGLIPPDWGNSSMKRPLEANHIDSLLLADLLCVYHCEIIKTLTLIPDHIINDVEQMKVENIPFNYNNLLRADKVFHFTHQQAMIITCILKPDKIRNLSNHWFYLSEPMNQFNDGSFVILDNDKAFVSLKMIAGLLNIELSIIENYVENHEEIQKFSLDYDENIDSSGFVPVAPSGYINSDGFDTVVSLYAMYNTGDNLCAKTLYRNIARKGAKDFIFKELGLPLHKW